VVTAKNFFGSYVTKDRLPPFNIRKSGSRLNEASPVSAFLVIRRRQAEAPALRRSARFLREGMPPKCILYREKQGQKARLPGQTQLSVQCSTLTFSVCMSADASSLPFDAIRWNADSS